ADLEGARLAEDHRAYAELHHQATAVPTRRQRGGHDGVPIRALATRFAEGIGLAVDAGIVLLHTAVVATAEERAVATEQRSSDGDAAFFQPLARLFQRHGEHATEAGEVVRLRASARDTPMVAAMRVVAVATTLSAPVGVVARSARLVGHVGLPWFTLHQRRRRSRSIPGASIHHADQQRDGLVVRQALVAYQ